MTHRICSVFRSSQCQKTLPGSQILGGAAVHRCGTPCILIKGPQALRARSRTRSANSPAVNLSRGRWSRCCLGCWLGVEIRLRNLSRPFRSLEVRLIRLEPGKTSNQIVRKLEQVSVVVLQGIVIALALDC